MLGAIIESLARASADAYNLDYEWIDGAEIRRRFPAWNVPDAWVACYTSQAGYLEVGPAMRAMASARDIVPGHRRFAGLL